MYDIVTYEESLEEENKVYIDVRTSKEHEEMTIPGSISCPIFTNREREIIGTEFIKGSKEHAKLLGLNFAKDKLSTFFEIFEKYKQEEKKIYVFCSRGGYRSKSVVALFNSLGFPVYQIKGGYKSYRYYIHSRLDELINSKTYICLYGYTGTGKTHLLKTLKKKGYSILDIEGLANHKGSVLGGVLEDPQPSQKMFESLLYESLLESGDIIFTEGESRKVGTLYLPNSLYDKLQTSVKVEVQSSLENRTNRIFHDYVKNNDQELKDALEELNRYISKENIKIFQDIIDEKRYEEVIERLIVGYYDKAYSTKEKNFSYNISSDEKDAIEKLENIYKEVQMGIRKRGVVE